MAGARLRHRTASSGDRHQCQVSGEQRRYTHCALDRVDWRSHLGAGKGRAVSNHDIVVPGSHQTNLGLGLSNNYTGSVVSFKLALHHLGYLPFTPPAVRINIYRVPTASAIATGLSPQPCHQGQPKHAPPKQAHCSLIFSSGTVLILFPTLIKAPVSNSPSGTSTLLPLRGSWRHSQDSWCRPINCPRGTYLT